MLSITDGGHFPFYEIQMAFKHYIVITIENYDSFGNRTNVPGDFASQHPEENVLVIIRGIDSMEGCRVH